MLFLTHYLLNFHFIKEEGENVYIGLRDFWKGTSVDDLDINIEGLKGILIGYCLLEHFTSLNKDGKLLFGEANKDALNKNINDGISFIESWIKRKLQIMKNIKSGMKIME